MQSVFTSENNKKEVFYKKKTPYKKIKLHNHKKNNHIL